MKFITCNYVVKSVNRENNSSSTPKPKYTYANDNGGTAVAFVETHQSTLGISVL